MTPEENREEKLKVDPSRWEDKKAHGLTGIFVRAQDPNGKWVNADICQLTAESLLAWLKGRGGDNPWAEDVVGCLLGYGHLHGSDC